MQLKSHPTASTASVGASGRPLSKDELTHNQALIRPPIGVGRTHLRHWIVDGSLRTSPVSRSVEKVQAVDSR